MVLFCLQLNKRYDNIKMSKFVNIDQEEKCMYIDSTSNKIVKHTKKLFDRSARREHRQFVIEGRRLVADAVRCGADIEYILLKQGTEFDAPVDCEVYELSEKAFSALKTTVNSQGIAGVVNLGEQTGFSPSEDKACFYVYLDGVSDPGNMGTIIRTADAFGADGVVVSANCVDVYNPKVVRSTMASIFNIPIYFDDSERSIINKMKQKSIKLVSGSLQTERSLFEADLTGRCAIVIGNEANGITEEVVSISDELVKIPILGRAESLNAAVACSVMIYERMRQTK